MSFSSRASEACSDHARLETSSGHYSPPLYENRSEDEDNEHEISIKVAGNRQTTNNANKEGKVNFSLFSNLQTILA